MIKSLLIITLIFSNFYLLANDNNTSQEVIVPVLKKMSVAQKKENFYTLMVPAVEEVHTEWMSRYYKIRRDIINRKNRAEIKRLKKIYKAESDIELLYALHPHPQSIVLAQGAMESAWATSRFFREANNVFGMWSSNPNEPRIPAGIKRSDGRVIWLKKFESVGDSIRAYYELMAKGKAFKEFRKMRYQTDDVFELVKYLDKYSELGDLYGKELAQVIRFNKLTRYDK